MRPLKLVLIGFLLVLLGAVLPFLMVIRIVEPSFLLSFISYGASVGGLFLGVIGAASYVGNVRRRRDY
ncbi:MAG: hypothetical protein Fur0021_17300 [Candidatus Promineifilaceae bacterium]